MPRDFYESTIALPDTDGVMKALKDVNVYVVPRGAQNYQQATVDIYAADTGATRGPDPKAGATGINPILTGPSGSIRFWAEGPAEYDLVFEDSKAPARIADRIGWNCWPAQTGSIATKVLAEDAGITLKMLAAEVRRQLSPIGEVIEWWRPNLSVPPPNGWEICDGHPVTTHDFPIGGSIVLPDLRDKFILGADASKANGVGMGTNKDVWDDVANSPGVGAAGGSNRDTLGIPEMPLHGHGVTDPGHTHATDGAGDHAHGITVNGAPVVDPNIWVIPYSSGVLTLPPPSAYSLGQPGIPQASVGSWGGTAGGHAHTASCSPAGAHGHTALNHATGISLVGAGGGNPHNNMPLWVGLLRLMKVRWS